MNKICASIFLALLSLSIHVAGAVLSNTNNEIYIAISGTSTAYEPVRFDERLVWRPFCNTDVVQINYPDPEYLVKFKMTGPDGKERTKTELGKKFGSAFDKVRRYKDTINGSHMGNITAQGGYDRSEGVLSGPLLPKPEELFAMTNAGVYTLEIQMQMFRIVKGTNNWTREMIRFDPVQIKIEKPLGK
jgi:hypothetical protein